LSFVFSAEEEEEMTVGDVFGGDDQLENAVVVFCFLLVLLLFV